jgi:uncharacterized protein YggE
VTATEPVPGLRDVIVVPGVGRVSVEPDVASVRLGVMLTRPTAAAAREDAATTMNAVLAAIAAADVKRPDVRTSLVALQPITDHRPDREPRVTGYQLTNRVDVTVRDIDRTGAIVDAAFAAGASSLDGLGFRLEDRTAPEAEARAAAVADARARAEALAAAAGVAVGAVVGIVEGGAVPGPTPRGFAPQALAASADTPIEGGTQEMVVSVVVTFAIG